MTPEGGRNRISGSSNSGWNFLRFKMQRQWMGCSLSWQKCFPCHVQWAVMPTEHWALKQTGMCGKCLAPTCRAVDKGVPAVPLDGARASRGGPSKGVNWQWAGSVISAAGGGAVAGAGPLCGSLCSSCKLAPFPLPPTGFWLLRREPCRGSVPVVAPLTS